MVSNKHLFQSPGRSSIASVLRMEQKLCSVLVFGGGVRGFPEAIPSGITELLWLKFGWVQQGLVLQLLLVVGVRGFLLRS